MNAGPGRGRPVIFDEPAQDAFLALVTAGTSIGDAAAKCGIGRKTPSQLAARCEPFARRLDDAKNAGRANRIQHGTPGAYNHHQCRCPRCTAAATHARSNAPDRKHAEIHHLPDTQNPAGETELPMLAEVS